MKPENVTCPDCGGPMVSRQNKRDQSRFWGCAGYPKCRGTRNVDGETKRRASDDDDCREAQDNTPSRVWADRDSSRWREPS